MDIHFNGYKVKYPFLNYGMQSIRQSQNIRSINIFIDLDDLFHTLHRPLINNEFQVAGKNASKQFVSNIFNIAGHYRNWAIKEHLIPTVWLFYTSSKKTFKNSLYVPSYRERFLDINSDLNTNTYYINAAIKESYSIMHVISKYIPGVYIIDSKYLEPSIIPNVIVNLGHNKDWNLVVSRDIYMLQYSYMDKTTMVSPKGDNSIFINKGNLWDYIIGRERVYKDDIPHIYYNPELFIYAKALIGDKYRSIPRLKKIGWKTLFNYLNKAIEDSEIPLDLQIEKLVDLLNSKKVNIEEYNSNLYCSNVELQTDSLLESDKNIILDQIEDMEDYIALNNVNNSIFTRFPINLNFLCNKVVI